MAGTRTMNTEPRSTAYYYGDLEKIKRNQDTLKNEELPDLADSEVVNEAPIREVPPFRDRQWSLPEYSTPENSRKIDFYPESTRKMDYNQSERKDTPDFRKCEHTPECSRKGETYSTAGTFPMPETKEKEPLLAELEVVGRLPLTQLEPGVRRSRSWYLCCPNVGEEEISRESSWRYSSLRPVTSPPVPGHNGIMITTQTNHTEDVTTLKAERDALARALASERQRAASAARAHDARLAELHGVIAELVRRRAADKHAGVIMEEEVSDECESTTQPAGELDNDADRSRTDQNDSSSLLSPCELPTPREKVEPEDTTDTSAHELHIRLQVPAECPEEACDTSLSLSEKVSDVCLSTARCCEGGAAASADSCEREHGSDHRIYTASPGRCESRQAKIASRVKLKKTEEITDLINDEQSWCAERLAMNVCAQADLREAMIAAGADGTSSSLWRLRCTRLQAECAVLQAALARAADTAHRVYSSCAVREQACVGVCAALRAADRALELYDVLLALAETAHRPGTERSAAELVGLQLLTRLEAEADPVIGEPLLSSGPWVHHTPHPSEGGWSAARECALRAAAARYKALTVSLRPQHSPTLFSYHDEDLDEVPQPVGTFNMADMEAAVLMEELLANREAKAMRETRGETQEQHIQVHKSESSRVRRRSRHWLHTPASDTDL